MTDKIIENNNYRTIQEESIRKYRNLCLILGLDDEADNTPSRKIIKKNWMVRISVETSHIYVS